jgi:hypothetical protein
MLESISYQATAPQYNIPLPMALNGILTPAEYEEQTQLGLLRGIFKEELPVSAESDIEKKLYHPFLKH